MKAVYRCCCGIDVHLNRRVAVLDGMVEQYMTEEYAQALGWEPQPHAISA